MINTEPWASMQSVSPTGNQILLQLSPRVINSLKGAAIFSVVTKYFIHILCFIQAITFTQTRTKRYAGRVSAACLEKDSLKSLTALLVTDFSQNDVS